MWVIFIVRILLGLSDDARRPPRRRDRGPRRHRGAAPAGRRRAQGLGPRRTASPARATARRSPASSTTRCAGARRAPISWATRARARSRSACCGSSASSIPMRSRARRWRGALRRRRLTEAERDAARRRRSRRRAALGRSATIRNGSIRISPACSATSGPRRAPRWRRRAPLDLRVNALKGERDEAAAALADLDPVPTRWSPLRPAHHARADAKSPAIHAEPAFIKGMIEIQDEGSQLAALLAGAKPGEQVIDLCAGGGGKTLALAAHDGEQRPALRDRYRTSAGSRRSMTGSSASGARNVQVRTPKSIGNELADLDGRADLVLIDAPCTGIGTWRRNPDAKWRVRPGALDLRLEGAGRGARPRRRAGRSPAAASPMSPARCWSRRTATRCAHSSRAITGFASCRRPRSRTRSASAPICSAARC